MTVKKISSLLTFSAATLCAAIGAESARPTNAPPASVAGPQTLRPSLNPEANFTEEQSKVYHQALDSSREVMGNLWQKLRASRRELEELTKAEKLDEGAIRSKATELGKTEGDLSVMKAKILAQLRPVFSVEQLDRLARTPQLNGVTSMPPRRLGTNETNLRPKIQRPVEATPAPNTAPAK